MGGMAGVGSGPGAAVRRVAVIGFAAADVAIFERTCTWRELLAGWTPWWRRADVVRRRGLVRIEYRLINAHGRVLRAFAEDLDGRSGRPRTALSRPESIAERAAAWRAANPA